MKGGEEGRWGGEEEKRRGVYPWSGCASYFLRSSSGGFVYSRVEIGEEEIFLAPII